MARFSKRLLLSLCVASAFLVAGGALAADCTWTGATDTTWNTGTNWDCGHMPAVADNAIFNGGSPAITGVVTGPISSLQVINNAQVSMTASVAPTLTVSNGAIGLLITAGSKLTLSGATAITIALPLGTSGTVGGAMAFAGGAHRLTALSASPVTFSSGSNKS